MEYEQLHQGFELELSISFTLAISNIVSALLYTNSMYINLYNEQTNLFYLFLYLSLVRMRV